jgi:hypothetical protein
MGDNIMIRRRNLLKLAIAGAAIPTGLKNNVFISSAFASSLAANIQINWSSKVAQTSALTFGSNDYYQVQKPQAGADPTYQQRIAQLNLGLFRIHHAQLSNLWSDPVAQTWSVDKVQACYDIASYWTGRTLVQNIPNWPSWMRQDAAGLLDPNEHARYAQFCAQLVWIVNQQLNRQVKFWEPFNERETIYQQAGRLTELWSLYNQCAIAMKAVDPQIKVGGPVMSWDNTSLLGTFLQNCGGNVDFISWHRYASGNPKATTDSLMSATPNYAKQVANIRKVTTKYIPNRKVPLLLGEYNINYSWQSGENRQNTQIGAAWFASILKYLAEAGTDMVASWNLKDGIYGLIDPNNKLRPAATVFEWGTKYLIGDVIPSLSNQSVVEALVVRQPSGDCSLLLINKSSQTATVSLQSSLSATFLDLSTIAAGFYLDSTGLQTLSPQSLMGQYQLALAPYALALLRLPANHPFARKVVF